MTRGDPAMLAVAVERDGARIRLSGSLSLDSVPSVLASSRDWFEDGADLEIDLSGIERSDSAGVALLLEWLRRARAAGHGINYVNPPAQMRAIVEFCALGSVLPMEERQVTE